MEKIRDITEEQLQFMKQCYDPILEGICVQKYLETEDGKGDFLPVYVNQAFADDMGLPAEVMLKVTLRQV